MNVRYASADDIARHHESTGVAYPMNGDRVIDPLRSSLWAQPGVFAA